MHQVISMGCSNHPVLTVTTWPFWTTDLDGQKTTTPNHRNSNSTPFGDGEKPSCTNLVRIFFVYCDAFCVAHYSWNLLEPQLERRTPDPQNFNCRDMMFEVLDGFNWNYFCGNWNDAQLKWRTPKVPSYEATAMQTNRSRHLKLCH